MPIGDQKGRIFLYPPHTNNGFFFLFTTKYHISLYFILENMKKASRNSLRYDMVT